MQSQPYFPSLAAVFVFPAAAGTIRALTAQHHLGSFLLVSAESHEQFSPQRLGDVTASLALKTAARQKSGGAT